MRVHSIEKIEQIKDLRKRGHSINEIVHKLSVPKTTIWHHIQKIKVPPKYIKIIRSRQGGSKIRKEKDLLKAEEEAKRLLRNEFNQSSIVAATLYWAEGSKRRCEFINTDGDMIRLYLSILRGHFKIPETSIQPVLRIFTNHNVEESLNYWSKITKIPKGRFQIFINDGGTNGRTKYGMCRIIVKRGGFMLKLFKAIVNQICNGDLTKKDAPVAQLEEQLTPNEQVTGSSPVGGIKYK